MLSGRSIRLAQGTGHLDWEMAGNTIPPINWIAKAPAPYVSNTTQCQVLSKNNNKHNDQKLMEPDIQFFRG
jgi:hypothetical protein